MQTNRLPQMKDIFYGKFAWVEAEGEGDFIPIKLICVQGFYWDDTQDFEGWNIICGNEEYYMETLCELEYPIIAN